MNKKDVLLNINFISSFVLYLSSIMLAICIISGVTLYFLDDVFSIRYIHSSLTEQAFSNLIEEGRYHAAISVYEANENILKNAKSKHLIMEKVIDCYMAVGDYGSALVLLYDLDEYLKKYPPTNEEQKHELTIWLKLNLFNAYAHIGDKEKTKQMELELSECEKNSFNISKNLYLRLKHDKITIELERNIEKARLLLEKHLSFLERDGECLLKEKTWCHIMLARIYSHDSNNTACITHVNAALEAFLCQPYKLCGYTSNIYEYSGELSELCEYIGDSINAEYLRSRYLSYIENKYNPEDLTYINSRWIKFRQLELSGDTIALEEEVVRTCQNARKNLSINIDAMSESQREWYAYQIDGIFDYASNLLLSSKNERMSEVCMDNILFKKGLLLRSNNAVKNIVENSNDENLKTNYSKYRKITTEIVARRNLNDQINQLKVFLLEKEKDSLEHKIICSSKRIGNIFTENVLTTKDISKILGPDKLAIEFVESKSGSVFAIVIDKNGTHYVPIDKKQLLSFVYNLYDVYIADSLTLMLKKGLKSCVKSLEDKHTIYVSTSGIFNHINFCALRWDSNISVRQLSNISHIQCMDNDIWQCENFALWGGIEYGGKNVVNADHKINRVIHRGDTLMYLPYSKKEIRDICKTIQPLNVKVSLYEGIEATETSFKKRSNLGDEVIHISTHGFFESKREQNGRSSGMYNSGLLFANSNDCWTDPYNCSSEEDGILRAYEISQMNLKDCKLVVLSACTTGVGYDDLDEGVYGLQRAFFLAGASNIIMSLWQVNDATTCEFMSIFYDNVFNNHQNIYIAFDNTISVMRRRYLNPIDWAGFVLMY